MTIRYRHTHTGKRPAWLAHADVLYRREWSNGQIVCSPMTAGAINSDQWPALHTFDIAEGHWAVAPLRAGYEPWPGGDKAPEDWNGEQVMLRNGTFTVQGKSPMSWSHPWAISMSGDYDVIGYMKGDIRIAPPQPDYNIDPARITAVYDQARRLAVALCIKHFPDNKEWRVGHNLPLVLDQIDNITTALANRDDVVREVIARIRTLPTSIGFGPDIVRQTIADALTREFLPPDTSIRDALAIKLHTAAFPSVPPLIHTSEEYQRMAQWLIDTLHADDLEKVIK